MGKYSLIKTMVLYQCLDWRDLFLHANKVA